MAISSTLNFGRRLELTVLLCGLRNGGSGGARGAFGPFHRRARAATMLYASFGIGGLSVMPLMTESFLA